MLNKAILMGRLTADVELRSTPNGKKVCSFTLAVARRGQDAGTDWVDCVAWEKTAEFISKHFSKGQLMAVAGRIQTRNWEDNNGGKRKAVEVVVEEVHFAEGKKDGQGKSQSAGGFAPMAGLPDDDSDLPF